MGRLFWLAGALCVSLGFLAGPALSYAASSTYQAIRIDQVVRATNVPEAPRRGQVIFAERATTTGQQVKTIGRVIDISPSSARAVARQAMRFVGPASIALMAAMAAHDLYWSDDDINVMEEGEDFGYFADRGWRLTDAEISQPCEGALWPATGNAYYSSYARVIAAYTDLYVAGGILAGCLQNLAGSGQAVVVNGTRFYEAQAFAGATSRQLTFQSRYCIYSTSGEPCTPPTEWSSSGSMHTVTVYPYSVGEGWTGVHTDFPVPGVLAPASSAEVDAALSDSLLAQIIAEAIANGYAHVIPEIAAMAEQLSEWLDSEHENYDPVLDAQTAVGNPSINVTPGSSSSSSGSTAIEFPGFCEWAAIVCGFIDWFQAESVPPEDPEIPIVEVDDWDQVTVGAGSYTCPSPTNLGSFNGQSLDFDWTLPCDFATAARPLILLGSALMALLVLVGWRGAS